MVLNVNEDLAAIKEIENRQAGRNLQEGAFYPRFHLAPPAGWLNDPNGLCQLKGIHHIFFQYSPYEAEGGDKYWGHYETKDFVNYEYTGIFLLPDNPLDKDGVYSGSAFVEDDTMYLYYTGNVKEDGNFDYIYEGREANTILVTSKDGREASHKKELLGSVDYPSRLSCHVRDPKVWSESGRYYMVLGARTKNDKGTVMIYESEDKEKWKFLRYIETEDTFGFMWECPDLFELSGKKFLSLSPQGLEKEEYRFQNIYQCGYFPCGRDLEVKSENFVEWDMGFDFYAPQTYLDEKGRRILIGWMGVPGAEYDHDPSIDLGWQHMLSLPRELTYDSITKRICQWPVSEVDNLRKSIPLSSREAEHRKFYEWNTLPQTYEVVVDETGNSNFSAIFDDNLELYYDSEQAELSLEFYDWGYGRDKRKIKMSAPLSSLRIFVDTSCLEIFINRGNYTMSTKYFYTNSLADRRKLSVEGSYKNLTIYELDAISIKK